MKSNSSSERKKDLKTLENRISITVNGSAMELQQGITIQDLLDQLELDFRLVAVEQNLEIIPKARFREKQIANGDTIEIVQFVGGG